MTTFILVSLLQTLIDNLVPSNGFTSIYGKEMTMCIVYPFHAIMPEYPVINWIVQRHGQGDNFLTKDMHSYCIALEVHVDDLKLELLERQQYRT